MGEMSIVKNQLWPWQVDKYANSGSSGLSVRRS
jgi:hypothetical protein